MLLHPRFVIVKPPGGTLLDLADGIGILETAKDTADRFIVVGIQAVNNGFRKAGRHIERIQEICHLAGGRVIIDAVRSRIAGPVAGTWMYYYPFCNRNEAASPSLSAHIPLQQRS